MSSHPEDEYFARIDQENRAKLASALTAEAREAALAERRHHYAQRCGKCGGGMKPIPFRGVEIDVCQECGAVLLDKGELETLAGHDSTGLVSGLRALFGGS